MHVVTHRFGSLFQRLWQRKSVLGSKWAAFYVLGGGVKWWVGPPTVGTSLCTWGGRVSPSKLAIQGLSKIPSSYSSTPTLSKDIIIPCSNNKKRYFIDSAHVGRGGGQHLLTIGSLCVEAPNSCCIRCLWLWEREAPGALRMSYSISHLQNWNICPPVGVAMGANIYFQDWLGGGGMLKEMHSTGNVHTVLAQQPDLYYIVSW